MGLLWSADVTLNERVLLPGIEPETRPYQGRMLPLALQEHCVAPREGFEPSCPGLEGLAPLHRTRWYPREDSNLR